jgi:hypothetical protein
MWLIELGEVVYGGVGSGLYGMLVFAIIAVFGAGLMVGRTPEYLGKKIEAHEMKMAALVILILRPSSSWAPRSPSPLLAALPPSSTGARSRPTRDQSRSSCGRGPPSSHDRRALAIAASILALEISRRRAGC